MKKERSWLSVAHRLHSEGASISEIVTPQAPEEGDSLLHVRSTVFEQQLAHRDFAPDTPRKPPNSPMFLFLEPNSPVKPGFRLEVLCAVLGVGLLPLLTIVALVTQCSQESPLIKDDVVVLGLLVLVLQVVFGIGKCANATVTAIFRYVPALLLCYFVPGVMSSAGVMSSKHSRLPDVASHYFLPPCLVLLTLGTDIPAAARLGPKVLGMFAAGTVSVMFGGPLSLLLVGLYDRSLVGGETWQGLACMAGSWIGGSANQLAMKEIFKTSDEEYSKVIAVDVVVSNVWMAILLAMVTHAKDIDLLLQADSTVVTELASKLEQYHQQTARVTSFGDLVGIGFLSFGTTGAATWLGAAIGASLDTHLPALRQVSLTSPFFWMISVVTVVGVALSLTRARALEGGGASKIGSYLLYILVATIGMRLDVSALLKTPGLLAVAGCWIACHAAILFWAAFLTRSPFFFLAIGSMANIGGAASAPIVAAAFSQALAPVGVLLSVVGYAIGTMCAWMTGIMLHLTADFLGVAVALPEVIKLGP